MHGTPALNMIIIDISGKKTKLGRYVKKSQFTVFMPVVVFGEFLVDFAALYIYGSLTTVICAWGGWLNLIDTISLTDF